MSLKVKAVPGRMVLKVGAPGRHFIGYRECNRGADGNYLPDELVHHTVTGAPGITKVSTDTAGRVTAMEQTSDLFLAGREIRLTRYDLDGTEIVEEVPDESFYRMQIAEGGLVLADESKEK